ncbi:MAG TPA: hypothetical protein PKA13_21575 [Geminicoccaceae bacterium]|nr:hypothetical protein [Geminicoccus sp.]HMU52385.1 hypothetical protein [Geminicoccaceae bacterium]
MPKAELKLITTTESYSHLGDGEMLIVDIRGLMAAAHCLAKEVMEEEHQLFLQEGNKAVVHNTEAVGLHAVIVALMEKVAKLDDWWQEQHELTVAEQRAAA